MKLKNTYNLPVVECFIRLYGDILKNIEKSSYPVIRFLPLKDENNRFRDVIVRYKDSIYLSDSEIGKLGLSEVEIFAALAHEIGHIVYGMLPFGNDAETRADSFASELGLGTQMISVIEKIIQSHRYGNMTSQLVQRIYYLQHLENTIAV